jgi:hypothetical protein
LLISDLAEQRRVADKISEAFCIFGKTLPLAGWDYSYAAHPAWRRADGFVLQF